VERPADYLEWANRPQTAAEDEREATVRACLRRGRPFGAGPWLEATARALGLAAQPRPPGRPRKPV